MKNIFKKKEELSPWKKAAIKAVKKAAAKAEERIRTAGDLDNPYQYIICDVNITRHWQGDGEIMGEPTKFNCSDSGYFNTSFCETVNGK